MRSSRTLQLYSIFLIFLTTFTAAWPWPRWLPEMDSLIVVRQENQSSNTAQQTSATKTDTASPSATDNKSNTNTDNTSGTITGTATGSAAPTKTGTDTNTDTGTITSGPTTGDKTTGTTQATTANSTSYDPTNPAGGVSLLKPAITDGAQYYKIGSNVTFAWNYTSLLGTPTAVNVMATCTANQQLYTIAANQTIANATGAVTWDTGAYQSTALSDPLLTQTYTLIIYDAASSISATAQPGYLAVYNQYTFGMYSPQPYHDLDGWKCATCSGALGETEKRALGLMAGMAVLTVLSFTWFVNGLGVMW